MKICIALLSLAAPLALAAPDLSKLPPPAKKDGVTYAKDIRPLFEASCLRCHGNERPKAGLRLDSLEGVLKGSKEGKVIMPGKSQESLLVIAVSRLDEEKAMPPKPKGPRGGPGRPGGGGDGQQPPAGGPPGAGPGGQGGGRGPAPKPLTAEQVGLIRAWVDQGAK
jgi:hypothetical protein